MTTIKYFYYLALTVFWKVIACCLNQRSIYALAFVLACTSIPSAAQDRFIKIGAGQVTDLSNLYANYICRIVNERRMDHGVSCLSEVTSGSIENISTIRSQEFEFGIARSDWQFHAFNGTSKFKDQGRFEHLRTVFSLNSTPITFLVRKKFVENDDDDWEDEDKLSSMRISLQTPYMEGWLSSMRVSESSFKKRIDLDDKYVGSALCDEQIDAALLSVSHPSNYIKTIISACDVVIAACTAGGDEIPNDFPFLGKSILPKGTYGNQRDIEMLGLGATLVSSKSVSSETVYILVKAFFDNLDNFKKIFPELEYLVEEDMIKEFNSAPLHEGAAKYYKERGWIY